MVYTQYKEATREFENSNNPWYVRGGMLILGAAASPLALGEEYIGRSFANLPFAVHNAGIHLGEHIGRASLWSEQGEYGEMTVDILSTVQSGSEGFVAAAAVALPVAGALESRATSTAMSVEAETGMQVSPKNPLVGASESEIDSALNNVSSEHIYRVPVQATEAGNAVESMVPVSRWGRPGLESGDWIMNGPPSLSNFIRSFKWDPNPTNIRTPFSKGEGYLVPPQSVQWPSGWGLDGWWKGWFGQRKYIPPAP